MDSYGRVYIAIDLKSFYASVECVDRGLDPLTTNLVVADASRTDKTICLAVSPSLKAYGIGGRARLFEVVQKVKEIFGATGKKVEYITAPPRMSRYMEVSAKIYSIYLKYVAPEDIHVYSCDEVFIDATSYLRPLTSSQAKNFNLMEKAHDMAMTMIRDVLRTTGITATAGIGTNMYLCKVAMDIVAKHIPADKDGVRIATLDERTYREKLWDHRPITSFWRVGHGTASKLALYGIDTMGKLARMSLTNEPLLYRLFGVNAELLIDHAWGWEPCTMDYVKSYRPETNSLSSGQVLQSAYTFSKARVVIHEMADAVAMDLLDKGLVADQLVLTIGYDRESLNDPEIFSRYGGEIVNDYYGRKVPKQAHGSANIGRFTSSMKLISDATVQLFDRIVNPELLVRRLNITVNHVIPEESILKSGIKKGQAVQLDLFTDYEEQERLRQEEELKLTKERKMQEAVLAIKKQFGKNSILKGLNYAEGATAKERNGQIGGHKS